MLNTILQDAGFFVLGAVAAFIYGYCRRKIIAKKVAEAVELRNHVSVAVANTIQAMVKPTPAPVAPVAAPVQTSVV